MAIKIKSPTFPESVSDGTVANWVKKEGETVLQDDVIEKLKPIKLYWKSLLLPMEKLQKFTKKKEMLFKVLN